MNGFVITKETWAELPAEQREWLLFDTLQSVNERLKIVEKRPLLDKCIAFAGGIIGGFLAALGYKWVQ